MTIRDILVPEYDITIYTNDNHINITKYINEALGERSDQ